MDMDFIINVLYAMIRTGTPLLIVALGELVCERSGVLNLGQEGMMLVGAVGGFIVALTTGSLVLGILAAMLAGCLMALFGVVALGLSATQVATGLALTILGGGLSAFIGERFVGQTLVGFKAVPIPYLSDLALLGPLLFNHDVLVYVSFGLFAGVIWFLRSTRAGLILKAIGETPESATAVGLPVMRVRYLAVLFGGAMAGLAGGYLSLAYTPLWAEGMTAGRGWIALALVVFASWRAERVMFGAYLFGLASILHLIVQGMGVSISSNLLALLPYVVTILVLVLLSSNQARVRLYAPMSLGKPFHRTQ
jgi:simple sugar transport system permease protein